MENTIPSTISLFTPQTEDELLESNLIFMRDSDPIITKAETSFASESCLPDEDIEDMYRSNNGEVGNQEEVFTAEQFIINDKTPLPVLVRKERDNVCDALRLLAPLVEMEDFEADPLQFWFLTRLVDVFSDAKTRGCSDVVLKSTVCWLGYVLHKIINTKISREELFEDTKALLLDAIRLYIRWHIMPTPLNVLKERENPTGQESVAEENTAESPKSKKGNSQSSIPGKSKKLGKSKAQIANQKAEKSSVHENVTVEKENLQFITTWIYQMFADACTFDTVRHLMPLRRRLLTCSGKRC